MSNDTYTRKVSFTIYEKPIPLQRHRHNSHCTYDPQKDQKEVTSFLIKECLAANTPHLDGSHLDGSHLDGPLHLIVQFYFKLPKTKSLRNKKGLYHTSTPDLDNLIKYILDVMNTLIYKDDAQIFKISAQKLYTTLKPRTEITIQEVEQADIIIEKKEKDNGKKDNTIIPARIY